MITNSYENKGRTKEASFKILSKVGEFEGDVWEKEKKQRVFDRSTMAEKTQKKQIK